jgi:hypothetical protein
MKRASGVFVRTPLNFAGSTPARATIFFSKSTEAGGSGNSRIKNLFLVEGTVQFR